MQGLEMWASDGKIGDLAGSKEPMVGLLTLRTSVVGKLHSSQISTCDWHAKLLYSC